MLWSSLATATLDATNDEDLKPLQKPSLLAKIKFDLSSVKLDSVFTIFLSLEAEVSSLDKYLILSSFSIWVSSYKFNSLTSRS